MRQEERKIQARRKIMDNALLEFATRGYSASFVNNIYDSEQGISKGLIYHYFKSKDELFLACVEECFEQLKEYIQNHIFIETESSSLKECLSQYYKTRMIFFHENPLYQKIFCEAVIMDIFLFGVVKKETI